MSYLIRKAATISTPVMEVTEDNGVWSFKTATTLKSMDLKFKVSCLIEKQFLESLLQNSKMKNYSYCY